MYFQYWYFILFNIILALVWEIRTTYKLKNLKPYSDEVLKILDLNEEWTFFIFRNMDKSKI